MLFRSEVTFAEWDLCVREGGCSHNPSDLGWGRGRRPVINVSWQDAKGYVEWLSGKTGKRYRLLSEAEWEYIARARSNTPFSTGLNINPTQANYGSTDSYAGSVTAISDQKTAEVGGFQANAFGLHDMHGNVWEWTEDCYDGSYNSAPRDGAASSSGDCGRRVLRGGSWNDSPQNLRSAVRYWSGPILRYDYVGFRVARAD